MKVLLVTALAFFLFPSIAFAGYCDINKRYISAELVKESRDWSNLSQPVSRSQADKAPQMPRKTVRKMLRATWQSFGYRGKALRFRIRANLKQISLDSDLRPHIDGSFSDESSLPYFETSKGLMGGPPGGLFAFYVQDHRVWKASKSWSGADSKWDPLSNIFAAVQAQVQGKKVFSGKGRISLPKRNTCL